MKSKLIIALLLTSFLQSSAQSNSVEMGVGGYHFFNVITSHDRLLSNIKISYGRKLNDKYTLMLAYVRSPVYFNGTKTNIYSTYKPLTTEEYDTDSNSIGKIHNRYNFNYYDISLNYNLIRRKRHLIQAGIGISIANGINSYKTELVLSPPDPGGWVDVLHIERNFKRETHLGGLMQLKYSYSIYKEKLMVGGNASARFYNKGFPFQINYGIHIGYNF